MAIFSIGNIAKRIDFKISHVPNHVPNHVNFWWGKGLWPWPSRDSEWYFVSFFHPFRFENNWVFKAPHIFRDVKISQNYSTLSIYSFFISFISLKTKFYWFEAIGVKGQLILKCLLVFSKSSKNERKQADHSS